MTDFQYWLFEIMIKICCHFYSILDLRKIWRAQIVNRTLRSFKKSSTRPPTESRLTKTTSSGTTITHIRPKNDPVVGQIFSVTARAENPARLPDLETVRWPFWDEAFVAARARSTRSRRIKCRWPTTRQPLPSRQPPIPTAEARNEFHESSRTHILRLRWLRRVLSCCRAEHLHLRLWPSNSNSQTFKLRLSKSNIWRIWR